MAWAFLEKDVCLLDLAGEDGYDALEEDTFALQRQEGAWGLVLDVTGAPLEDRFLLALADCLNDLRNHVAALAVVGAGTYDQSRINRVLRRRFPTSVPLYFAAARQEALDWLGQRETL